MLTASGAELTPVLLALWQWGDRHLADELGPGLQLRHRDCGEPVRVQIRCEADHEVALDEITVQAPRRRTTR